MATTTVNGPIRPVTRTIQDDLSSSVNDGVRGYSSASYTQDEAEAKVEKQTDTLLICQLWDTTSGLQWENQSAWNEALTAFKASA